MNTRELIIQESVQIFARNGYDGLRMKDVALAVGIVPSVLYYYFENKDVLLKSMFDQINTSLGIARAKLPFQMCVANMLQQRVHFQLDHAEEIVAVLRYYISFRDQFVQVDGGFVPKKAYLHIEEVLHFGIATGELDTSTDIDEDAKVITHAINGFLLEYYPLVPEGEEREILVSRICRFLLRGLLWQNRKI